MRREIMQLLANGSLSEQIAYMQAHGQSVLLNWGEDDNLWECSWITGGERFTGLTNRSAEMAVRQCLQLVRDALSREATMTSGNCGLR